MPAVSPAMVAIAAAVLVTFIGGLYFITHHKKEESETLQNQKVTGNGLPPKPEERWRYIKELESRQPGVRTPTEPSAGGEVMNPNQLTSEQRQLLEQMQADMRQQPTQLNEVPWNEQTPEQRQQTLQRQRQAQQQQWAQTQPVQQPRTQPRVNEQPQTRTVQSAPAQPARRSRRPRSNLIRICCKRRRIPARQRQKPRPLRARLKRRRRQQRKKMNVAGWCNVVHSKAPSRQKASALSWRLKALTPKLPPITAGIAWLSGR
ncbi:cell division protein FtsN [Salmonella enterica subsp. enterica]